MITINLSPQRRDDTLAITCSGTVLTINGDDLDLSGIPDGATYPNASELHPFLSGSIVREGGVYELTVLLPHGADAEAYQTFPAPVVVVEDGPVDLPANTYTTELDPVEVAVNEDYPYGATKYETVTHRWHQEDTSEVRFVPNPAPEEEE